MVFAILDDWNLRRADSESLSPSGSWPMTPLSSLLEEILK
jgi:hypothetical protein